MTDIRHATTTQSPMEVRYLHHVSFRVDDLEAALDFYGRILGFTALARPDLGFRGAWLQAGDVQVHLLELVADESTGFPPNQVSGKANHVAFSVRDLEAYRRYLQEQGLDITGAASALPQMFVKDPSGNVIEFTGLER
jgi:glyoxylase I family protein